MHRHVEKDFATNKVPIPCSRLAYDSHDTDYSLGLHQTRHQRVFQSTATVHSARNNFLDRFYAGFELFSSGCQAVHSIRLLRLNTGSRSSADLPNAVHSHLFLGKYGASSLYRRQVYRTSYYRLSLSLALLLHYPPLATHLGFLSKEGLGSSSYLIRGFDTKQGRYLVDLDKDPISQRS